MSSRVAPWALLAAALGSGCGGPGAFRLDQPDGELGGLDEARRAFAAAAPDSGPASVVVATGGGALVAYAVADRPEKRWRVPTAADLPTIAGDWVLTEEGGAVVGRRLRDGARRIREGTDGLFFVGADGIGDDAVVVLSTGTSTAPRSEVWILGARGVVRRLALAQAAGAPAWAGAAWVPWGSHFLSAIDPRTGDERARLRWDGEMLSAARRGPRTLWAGHDRTVRLGTPGEPTTSPRPVPADPVRAGAAALDVDVDALDLPVARPFVDGYRVPRPRGGGFDDRQWLLWAPGDAAPAPVLVTPRSAVGLPAGGGGARWAMPFDDDVVAAAGTPGGGTLLVFRRGDLVVVDAEGRERARHVLEACADGGCLGAAFAGVWDPPAAGGGGGSAADATAGLEAVLRAPGDPRSVAPLVAADALRTAPDPAATAALIRLCEGAARDALARSLACEALARRTRGLEHVTAALAGRSDHLAGTRAPPIAALARAAAHARARDAVPLLIAKLRDPATPSSALPPVARALGALGAQSAAAPLEDFLRLYHADAPDEGVAEALQAAVDALVALRGPLVEPLLTELVDAPFTQSALRAHATAALETLAPPADGDPPP